MKPQRDVIKDGLVVFLAILVVVMFISFIGCASTGTKISSPTIQKHIATEFEGYPDLKKGDVGEYVKILQTKLGITADGDFGPKTEAAVKSFQGKNNISVKYPGTVGQKTWKVLFAEQPARITELSWKQPGWDKTLLAGITEHKALFDKASDITEICPNYKNISTELQTLAAAEFSVALAYFESGFRPGLNSVDVGSKEDKGSWSVGLYQMSANDRSARKFNMTFEKLKDPHANIKVYLEQMKTQLERSNKVFLNNTDTGRYWATLLRGNRYEKIPEIKARVLKYAPACKLK